MLAFLLVSQVVRITVHRVASSKYETLAWDVDLASKERPDVLFIGASQVEMGISPPTFDAELASKGYNLRSYNLGIRALSVPEMAYVIRRFLDQTPCCARYVILSPCYQCIYVSLRTNNIRSIEFFDVVNTILFMRYLFSYQVLFPDPITSRLTYIGHALSAMVRHYTGLGLGAATLGFGEFDDLDRLPPGIERGPRGQLTTTIVMSKASAEIYLQGLAKSREERASRIASLEANPVDGPDTLLSDGNFKFLADLINFLQSRNVSVLVAPPPTLWVWQADADLVAKVIVHCPGLPVIDFGDSRQYPELFLPTDIRFDSAHLAMRGADLWSAELADKFAELLRSGGINTDARCTVPAG